MRVTKYILRRKITTSAMLEGDGPLPVWWGNNGWLGRLELAHFMDMGTADSLAKEMRRVHEQVEVVPVTISEGA